MSHTLARAHHLDIPSHHKIPGLILPSKTLSKPTSLSINTANSHPNLFLKTLRNKPSRPRTIPIKAKVSEEELLLDGKDWSVLDDGSTWKIKRVIEAALINEEQPKVVVSMGNLGFVDGLLDTSPSANVTVYHYSLVHLADIKEKYDDVRCKIGDVCTSPTLSNALDVVFLNHVTAMKGSVSKVLGGLIARSSPGARLIISDTQGRSRFLENKRSYPDIVVGELPDQTELEKILERHPLQLIDFNDEPNFYLAALKVSGA